MKHYKTALAAIVSTALMATTPAWAGGKENDSGAATAGNEISDSAKASRVKGSFTFSIQQEFLGTVSPTILSFLEELTGGQPLLVLGSPTDGVSVTDEDS